MQKKRIIYKGALTVAILLSTTSFIGCTKSSDDLLNKKGAKSNAQQVNAMHTENTNTTNTESDESNAQEVNFTYATDIDTLGKGSKATRGDKLFNNEGRYILPARMIQECKKELEFSDIFEVNSSICEQQPITLLQSRRADERSSSGIPIFVTRNKLAYHVGVGINDVRLINKEDKAYVPYEEFYKKAEADAEHSQISDNDLAFVDKVDKVIDGHEYKEDVLTYKSKVGDYVVSMKENDVTVDGRVPDILFTQEYYEGCTRFRKYLDVDKNYPFLLDLAKNVQFLGGYIKSDVNVLKVDEYAIYFDYYRPTWGFEEYITSEKLDEMKNNSANQEERSIYSISFGHELWSYTEIDHLYDYADAYEWKEEDKEDKDYYGECIGYDGKHYNYKIYKARKDNQTAIQFYDDEGEFVCYAIVDTNNYNEHKLKIFDNVFTKVK